MVKVLGSEDLFWFDPLHWGSNLPLGGMTILKTHLHALIWTTNYNMFNDYVLFTKGREPWFLIIKYVKQLHLWIRPFDLFKIKELKGKGGAKQLLEMIFLFWIFFTFYHKYWNCSNTIYWIWSSCDDVVILIFPTH
jgi:hypothetical protein